MTPTPPSRSVHVGLDVPLFGERIVRLLEGMSFPTGIGIDNMYISIPVFTLSYDQDADRTAHIVEAPPEAAACAASRTPFPSRAALRRPLRAEERRIAGRRKVQAMGLPVFDRLPGVAEVLAAMRHQERLPRNLR